MKGTVITTGPEGILWQYQKDVPNDTITDSQSFKFKTKITGRTPVNGSTKDVEILVPVILVQLLKNS